MQDKVVLVTGGARGIGRAISEAFLNAGAKVMIGDLGAKAGDWTYDLSGADALQRSAKEQAAIGAVKATELDVTDAASCEAAVAATVAAFGGIGCTNLHQGAQLRIPFPILHRSSVRMAPLFICAIADIRPRP